MVNRATENREVAEQLEEVALLLERQHANPFRVRAYRRAAETVRTLYRPLSELLADEGREALERQPAIGPSLASAISEIVHTGRLAMLQRLCGQVSPEDLFTMVPGIGEVLAHRIVTELGIETLEDLEAAAHDGRLDALPGFGPRRGLAVRQSLAATLGRSMRRRARRIQAADPQLTGPPDRPTVPMLLDVDAEYRRRAAAGELRCIAPRRFNPRHTPWLPILHTDRDGWTFTALFSNTALAHQLGRTHDWVVIYYERDGHEDQCTVVTETRGPLAGQRVVRGREAASCDRSRPVNRIPAPAKHAG